ncbi:MAG: hypothetical protein KKA46_14970 [Proteobacteria bacterium]|nr:hypothetical protein [Pseudomonadota bacterium]MBV1714835.1 hypothetical protein [Desulfarculus sp.]
MKEYNSNIVLGLFPELILKNSQIKKLKEAPELSNILDYIANRTLPKKAKAVYFVLRECHNTLEEAVNIYKDVYNEIEEESLRRSGSRARERVIREALKSPEIQEWKAAWLEKNNNLKAAGQ